MAAVASQDIDWQALKVLVFGAGVKEAVFQRWLQPLTFGLKEPVALLQEAGGPCAVLAPLQAFLLKQCLEAKVADTGSLSSASVTRLLVGAMCDILAQCSSQGSFVLARVSQEVAQIIQVGVILRHHITQYILTYHLYFQDTAEQSSSKRARHTSGDDTASGSSLVDIDTFHTFLTIQTFNCVKLLGNYLEDHFSDIFGTKYDIVSFLYSVVLTKGPDNVASERQDIDESLIGNVIT